MGLKLLDFLIKPLDSIGKWFGEDQIANITKSHASKRLDYVSNH